MNYHIYDGSTKYSTLNHIYYLVGTNTGLPAVDYLSYVREQMHKDYQNEYNLTEPLDKNDICINYYTLGGSFVSSDDFCRRMTDDEATSWVPKQQG